MTWMAYTTKDGLSDFEAGTRQELLNAMADYYHEREAYCPFIYQLTVADEHGHEALMDPSPFENELSVMLREMDDNAFYQADHDRGTAQMTGRM